MFHGCSVPAAVDMADKEFSSHAFVVCIFRILTVIVAHEAEDDAFHHVWRMIGLWHDVLI